MAPSQETHIGDIVKENAQNFRDDFMSLRTTQPFQFYGIVALIFGLVALVVLVLLHSCGCVAGHKKGGKKSRKKNRRGGNRRGHDHEEDYSDEEMG